MMSHFSLQTPVCRLIALGGVALVGCAAPPRPAAVTMRPAGVAGGLAVSRDGAELHVRGRGISLDVPEAEWAAAEVSPLRVRLVGRASGRPLTIVSDGRAWFDGEPRRADGGETSAADEAAAGSPGRVAVADAEGRTDRSTSGDANNDGFNEQLGAYQIVASGRRVDLTILPDGPPLPRPVVEIAGLPAGEVAATTGGRLIESAARLPDGRVLVVVPFDVRSPTAVTVQVR